MSDDDTDPDVGGMTLAGASELAMDIFDRDDPSVDVIAIGRFRPPETLTASSPWGVSLVVDDRRVVVWSRAEWDALRAPEDTAEAEFVTPNETPVAANRTQPSLF